MGKRIYFTPETKKEAVRANARKSVKKHAQKLKLETFAAYGGAICACCRESVLKFLSLDHINNDGGEERKRRSKSGKNRIPSTNQYRALRDAGYPSGYQVLCMNCNFGKRMNHGICPHKCSLDV